MNVPDFPSAKETCQKSKLKYEEDSANRASVILEKIKAAISVEVNRGKFSIRWFFDPSQTQDVYSKISLFLMDKGYTVNIVKPSCTADFIDIHWGGH